MDRNISTRISPQARLFNDPSHPITKELVQIENQKKLRQCLYWGPINLLVLFIVTYDLMTTCSYNITYMQYFETGISVICGINIIYYIFVYTKVQQSKQQSQLNISATPKQNLNDTSNYEYQNVVVNSFSKTPMDFSAASWLTNTSQSGQNVSTPKLSRSFQNGTPQHNFSQMYKSSPLAASNLTKVELQDEDSIQKYIRDYETMETSFTAVEKTSNLLSLFWNHPAAKSPDSTSPLLKNLVYQISTPTASSSPKSDEKTSPTSNKSQGLETWRRLNVNSVALTQWKENLRIWISQTILSRLINEFSSIDKKFQAQNMTDVKIGAIGLDRLRKIAQGPIIQSIPNLPIILPFLELHVNQEYLVKRISELAKDGCMSEFKWNGGSGYNGKDWDTYLPTDSAIVMHLIATYLDTQLLPLPSQPDIKPFAGYHFIKANEKLPKLTDSTMAIHEVTINPPHYRVIIGTQIYELDKGYNNLFHSFLLFLYHVDFNENGMLGRVNLGRAGINMLWIIGSN